MEYWILFGVFTALMLVGTPIAFCLGIASFATVLYLGRPAMVVFQQLNSGLAGFTLLAIPFFIFAGDLMMRGGIAARIIAFAGSLIGHVRLCCSGSCCRWWDHDPTDEGTRLWC
jgi:TRAP-type mannitol/chloroaromatic compound transport system permease large subunit